MKKIKNIVFDIGNVLTDYRWQEFLNEKGYSPEITDRVAKATFLSEYWKEYDRGEWTEEDILAAFIKKDPGVKEQILQTLSNLHELVTIKTYAIPWIQEWKQKGYGVYYLSNFSKKAQEECADALTFIPYTDGGILSYQDKMIKPDMEIFKLFLSRFSLKAEECVFLDDIEENVQGARAAGMSGICFLSKEQAIEELKKIGVE